MRMIKKYLKKNISPQKRIIHELRLTYNNEM